MGSVSKWNAFGFMCSFLIPLVAVIFLKEKTTLNAFIVLGQGHFLLTYLYQWRAGRIGPTYLALYALAGGALLFAFAAIPEPQLWTLVAAGTIFAIHFFVDEMHINGLTLTRNTKLLGVAFVLLYSALLMRYAYDVDAPYFVTAAVLALCAPLVFARWREGSITAPEMFFLSGIGILLLMLFAPWSVSLVSALGYIILFHYTRWYLFFYFKFNEEPDGARFNRYIRDVGAVNAVVIGAYLFYAYFPQAWPLQYVFEQSYFFAWTILHVLFSIRLPKRVTNVTTHATAR